jgi:DNA-binding NtrC family response regulator
LVPIHLPPLRERREDIPLLVEHLIRRAAEACGRRVRGVSEDALRLLVDYHWPGNVRELAHVLEWAVTLSHGPVLTVDDLSVELRETDRRPAKGGSLTLAEAKRRHVLRALAESGQHEAGSRAPGRRSALALPDSRAARERLREGQRAGR